MNVMVVEVKKYEAFTWAGEENKEKWVTNWPNYLRNFRDQDLD